MTVCCTAAVLAFGLAACGGGGSTSMTMDDTTPPVEMPMPTPAEQLAAAQMAVSDAEEAVAAATDATERAAAYGQLAAAEQMLAEAETIPENVLAALRQRLADAESDLGEAETAATNLRNALDAVNAAEEAAAALDADSDQAAVTAAMALVTAAHNAVNALDADDQDRLSSQVYGANNMVMAAQTRIDNAAAVAAATKAAGTKVVAIGEEADQTDDAGLGGDDASALTVDADGSYGISIERDSMATKVVITTYGDVVNDNNDETTTDMEDDVSFTQAMDFGDGRTMHTLKMDADDDGNVVEEVAIVATDIEAPEATAFGKVHTLDVRVDGEDATDDMPDDALEIATANIGMVMADAFVAPAGTTGTTILTFQHAVEDDDSTMDVDETMAAAEIMGTFDGAMGTYKCADDANNCSVTVDGEGVVSAVANDWIFIPASGVTIDVDDTDYLHYGFWLTKTTDSDDATTYDEVETFAGATGHPETIDNDLETVVGTATYEGGTVGVYVKNVLDDQANIVSATSGHFKADVELNASFGGGNVAANDQFTIGGTVSKFALQHSEENDWAVKLGLADFSGRADGDDPGESAPGTTHDNEFSGVATGDSTAAAGSWNGIFYGSSASGDHDMDPDTPVTSPQPVVVIGEFNANFTDGTAIGGYGVNKK